MDRFKVISLTVTREDIHVLQESLWHSIQRGDISDQDRERMYKLRDELKEFNED